jgi:hypothetical protein
MKDTRKDQAMYCADSPHLSVRPDLWRNLTQAQETEIHEVVKIEERPPREKNIIEVMKKMIDTGELTFTSDGRAILRYPPPAKN